MMVTIHVTQDDIDHGVAADCQHCPVARAIYRVLEKPVTVGAVSWAIVDRELGYMEHPLPLSARSWITLFDDGNPVRPFTFTLTIPDTDPVAVRARLAELELTARGD